MDWGSSNLVLTYVALQVLLQYVCRLSSDPPSHCRLPQHVEGILAIWRFYTPIDSTIYTTPSLPYSPVSMKIESGDKKR